MVSMDQAVGMLMIDHTLTAKYMGVIGLALGKMVIKQRANRWQSQG